MSYSGYPGFTFCLST